MKFLAETHDPRTQPAIAKALKDFEMGKTDDEVRVSCESINAMAKAGVKLDQTVVDELWNVFAKFQLSKAHERAPLPRRFTTPSLRCTTRATATRRSRS